MKTNKSNQIILDANQVSYERSVAEILEKKFLELQNNKEKINIALSGGSTPLPILNILKDVSLKWNKFSFFLVDERNVSADSSRSNYGNLKKYFFNYISSNSYPMITDENLDLSVKSYAQLLQKEVGKEVSFDLILLGMGEDGHTASLFPNTSALHEMEKNVVQNYVESLDEKRITLTYPILLNAKELFVIIKGEKKKNILQKMYSGEKVEYPIYKLIASNAKISWIISK